MNNINVAPSLSENKMNIIQVFICVLYHVKQESVRSRQLTQVISALRQFVSLCS